MMTIPLKSVPSQTLQTNLNGQNCTIKVYYKWTGIYFDLYVDNTPLVTGRIARNGVPLVRMKYTNFVGDFYFIDSQGKNDPQYQGLNTRWFLCYG